MREEQDRSGAIELLMPTIQSADLWRESGRYEAYGKEMLRIKDRHERDMLYGPTNEEMITAIFRSYVRSYKDLPLNLYHIQWKFRDEVRPRFGLMRGREFLMKDAYSFDLDFAGAKHAYNRMFVAYLRTFARMGLRSIPMVAESGPIGGNLSHEFIILADTGESEVFCDSDYLGFEVPGADVDFAHVGRLAGDRRQMDLALCGDLGEARRRGLRQARRPTSGVSARGIEVGHIFYFGTKYSEPMKAVVTGPDGVEQAGAYGLLRHRPEPAGRRHHRGLPRRGRHQMAGAGRAVQGHDPQSQAGRQRYRRGLRAALCRTDRQGRRHALHDLDERPGAKFATADLIGVPWQILVGPRGLAEGKVEVKRRADGQRELMSPADARGPVRRYDRMSLCAAAAGAATIARLETARIV